MNWRWTKENDDWIWELEEEDMDEHKDMDEREVFKFAPTVGF